MKLIRTTRANQQEDRATKRRDPPATATPSVKERLFKFSHRFLLYFFLPALAFHRLIGSLPPPGSSNSLVKSPTNVTPRTCPGPTYPLQPKLASPEMICLTTLTDEAAGSKYQKFVRWRNFDNLLSVTWDNKLHYVQKHGYRLFNESRNSLDTSRPPSWSKIRAARRLLQEEDCEWVFWLDADTVIMNSDIEVESFLPESHDMLITEQKGDSWNAGAWIIRRSEWSLHFLDAWWNMSSFVMPKGLAISGDNDALRYYLTHHKELFQSHILTVPRCYFNSVATWMKQGQDPNIAVEKIRVRVGTANSDLQIYHHGDFIAHVAGVNDKMKGTIELLKDAK